MRSQARARYSREAAAACRELPHQFRLTKYLPEVRGDSGAFLGDDWTSISDIGRRFGGRTLTLTEYLRVESRHVVAVASFMEESGVESVTVADAERGALPGLPLRDGLVLSPLQALDVVRHELREEAWCRLQDPGRFFVHVGYDYYVFIGSAVPCPRSIRLAAELGLFVEEQVMSLYHSDS